MTNFNLKRIKNTFSNNLPVFVSVLILILSIAFTINQLNIDTRNLKQNNKDSLDQFSNELHEQIIGRIGIMETILVNQWLNIDNISELYDYNRFLNIIPYFFNYSLSYLALNWINSSGLIQWVYPYERNIGAINKSVIYYTSGAGGINDAFAIAKYEHKTGFTRFSTFFQGGKGFVAYIPIIFNNITTGYFNLVFEITSILIDISMQNKPLEDYNFQIFENQTLVDDFNENFSLEDDFVVKKTIEFYNKLWIIYSRPNSSLIFKVSIFSSFLTFFFEIVLCISIYLLTNQLKKKNELIIGEFSKKEKLLEVMHHGKKLEALGTLSGGIAHDFNNILSSMNGHLELIQSEILPSSKLLQNSPKSYEELNYSILAIFKNIQRSKEITGQILAFSRQSTIDFEIIDLTKSILESVNLVKETNKKRTTFIVKLEGKLFVFGNQSKLLQIFMNILINSNNAVDEDNGLIEISCNKTIKINSDSLNNLQKKFPKIKFLDLFFEIKIRDNGHGMDKIQIQNAFDPFFTIKSSSNGNGLGLGIAYNNIKSMGGLITLESEPSKFTEVTISFPFVDKPHLEKKLEINYNKQEKNKELTFQSKTLILLDDEIDIIDSYSKIFASYGYNVTTFNNGKDAWEYYKDNFNKIDMILADINIPGIKRH